MVGLDNVLCAIAIGGEVDPKYQSLIEEGIQKGLIAVEWSYVLTEKGQKKIKEESNE